VPGQKFWPTSEVFDPKVVQAFSQIELADLCDPYSTKFSQSTSDFEPSLANEMSAPVAI
jgi:hypothetical protein